MNEFDGNQARPQGQTGGLRPMKQCPFCAEEILDDAVKCRYCGEFLAQGRPRGYPPPPPQGGMPGWVIVLIVGAVTFPVVIAIIAIIAAIAIPNLLESKKVANENAALVTLRVFTFAQEVHNAKYGRYGTAVMLNGDNLIDGQMAGCDKSVGPVTKSGYRFELDCNANGGSWCAVAWPVRWGDTGDRRYFISTDGTIKWSGTEGTNPDWNPTSSWKYLGDY